MEFFCDHDSLDRGSEVLLFTVHDGLGRAYLQVRQGEALWQHCAPVDLGLAADRVHLEDPSVYREWHSLHTVVEMTCKCFSS